VGVGAPRRNLSRSRRHSLGAISKKEAHRNPRHCSRAPLLAQDPRLSSGQRTEGDLEDPRRPHGRRTHVASFCEPAEDRPRVARRRYPTGLTNRRADTRARTREPVPPTSATGRPAFSFHVGERLSRNALPQFDADRNIAPLGKFLCPRRRGRHELCMTRRVGTTYLNLSSHHRLTSERVRRGSANITSRTMQGCAHTRQTAETAVNAGI
jgi:hypothetical protein